MHRSKLPITLFCLLPLLLLGVTALRAQETRPEPPQEKPMEVRYLEFVTPEVEETCALLAETHGVTFSEPVPELGNARIAKLAHGAQLSVRAPMHEEEQPVVRPYLFVDDIDAAFKAAEKAGAQIAVPPTDIPGHGRLAIYFLGGLQHGLWQR